jgi:DNA-binding SARP family transcriptional activator/tetratricopeptide (TPR) repeat protein
MCKLSLFGPPALERRGRSQHIPRRKARALLAYLAVTQQRHSREVLAALLWPEHDPRSSHADLSRILSSLRNSLGAGHFQTDRQSVALNEEANLWVDVVSFRRHLEDCRARSLAEPDDACRQKLASAVDLYRADFLAGFTLPACPDFDDWQLLQTEALRRDLGWALEKLTHAHEVRNDLTQAIVYAHRWVGVDPLHEPAQRRLIDLYARNGQLAEADRQYQVCERLLAEELGVEPQPETKLLYEQLRSGSYRTPMTTSRFPRFDLLERRPEPGHPFVARTRELARLGSYLDEILAGNGQIVFVTGDAGRGKTSLLVEFARRAQEAHPDLIFASGICNSFAGIGDPYLPFREVLGMLTGDIAALRIGGQMGVEQARRLWALLPLTTQAILEHGPQLLEVFVPGRGLLMRARAAAPAGASWLVALQGEVARRQQAPGTLEQTSLFGQFTSVLHHLAQEHPLLVTLDDLQWIDETSIGMLFHLGRRLAGSRVLIIGACRPDELHQGRLGETHPLVQVLDEFKRVYGDIFIDLARDDQAEGRAFVDAYLDAEPNRLEEAFRQKLFQRTEGHPLFTVELLRDMQDRGDLVQDGTGRWCQGKDLDWETFPARVEAVIARRVDHLNETLRAILSAASVEGERFTAEVVAQVLGQDEQTVLHSLSDQLTKRHRLVREQAEIKAGREFLSRYQFSHALFQEYIYHQLPAGERRRLHKAVAEVLVELYAGELDQVIAQLADHYSAAGDLGHAVHYHIQAGDLAYQKASLPAAAYHYRSVLAHWSETDLIGQARVLRKLGECLWVLSQHREAVETLQASYELSMQTEDNPGAVSAQRLLGRVYWELGESERAEQSHRQALALSEREPESEERAWALAGMSNFQMQVEYWDESIRLGEEALALARRLGTDELVIQCLCDLGSALSSKGDWDGLAMEKESLELALALNRPHDAGRGYLYFGEGLLYQGAYKQARDIFEQAIAYTRRMNVPYITDAAERMLAEVEWLTGDWQTALARLKPLIKKAGQGELAGTLGIYLGMTLGRIYNDLGQIETAHAQLRESLATIESSSARMVLLGEMLRTEVKLGYRDAIAAAVAEILDWTVQVTHLFPSINMTLLYICSLPGAFGLSDLVDAARTASEQLKRLNGQYRTQAIEACRLEGQGWLTLAEAESPKEYTYFERAAVCWQDLSHPYDQARALTGLGQALTQTDNEAGARAALGQAQALVNSLAAQLEDPLLKASFQKSALVQKIRSDLYP